VHQAGQPRWEITNYPNADRFFHVAYQDGDHYNSVRLADDDGHDDYYYEGVGSSPGGPISLAGLTDGKTPRLAERPRRAHREPSGAAVAETVARAGGAGKKSRARELLRVFGGCVDSASTALRAEVSYKGALRGGAGDDPAPGERETEGGGEAGEPRAADESGVSFSGSEDDWEPVVHKKSARGNGGRRAGRRRDPDVDGLDDRVAALRI
jgi:OTU domain-containing protein 3